MALFGNAESKEEKAEKKQKEILAKYNLTELNDPADVESVKKIVEELTGRGLMEFGAMLSGSEKDLLKVQMGYQRAMVEQNFIIIRQLDRLIKAIEK